MVCILLTDVGNIEQVLDEQDIELYFVSSSFERG